MSIYQRNICFINHSEHREIVIFNLSELLKNILAGGNAVVPPASFLYKKTPKDAVETTAFLRTIIIPLIYYTIRLID
ncbi:MAG: hypothetical protein LBE18_00355 [Planctomycetaceae bacterium]|nr:hypothetical protein [Planctomycetaceae bacterium]